MHRQCLASVLALFLLFFMLVSAPTVSTGGTRGASAAMLFGCQGVYHTVRGGQTLYGIAAMYGTTALRIARCNGLYSYTIYTGQTLVVPTSR